MLLWILWIYGILGSSLDSLWEHDLTEGFDNYLTNCSFEPSLVDASFQSRLFKELRRINGGMSVIIKARYLSDGKVYAIKQIPRRAQVRSTRLPDFDNRRHLVEKEMAALRALEGLSSVPRYYGMLTDRSHFNLITEWLDGWTLAEILSNKWNLQKHLLIAHLIKAVYETHQTGYLHGDIKLDNIMITKDGRVMLIDWGLAKRISHLHNPQLNLSGTLSYFAPEALNRREITAHSDWWALGVVIYAVLHDGQMPFDEFDTIRLINSVSTMDPDLSPLLSQLERRLLDKLLCKNPYGRWGDEEYVEMQRLWPHLDWKALPRMEIDK